MILSNTQLDESLSAGELTITPYDQRLLKRNSYLLRLHTTFRRIAGDKVLDTADPASIAASAGVVHDADSVVLNPDYLVLACSLEKLSIPRDTVGLLSGISNVARLGVLIHCTSQFVNAGFGQGEPSRVVFELTTVGGRRVKLYAGTPICHLALVRLSSSTTYPQVSQRTGQDSPDPSSLRMQFGHFYAPGSSGAPAIGNI